MMPDAPPARSPLLQAESLHLSFGGLAALAGISFDIHPCEILALIGPNGKTKTDLEMVYNYFPRLRDLRGRVSGYLSGGEQQMVVIGRAMMAHPKLMLLDEPSLGLAPLIVEQIFQVIKKINLLLPIY